jgi:hypothetical protein
MTLAELSENTGIPEEELVQFAAGQLALSARDRFAILNELADHAPKIEPREVRPGTREAYRKLFQEVVEEDQEENSSPIGPMLEQICIGYDDVSQLKKKE